MREPKHVGHIVKFGNTVGGLIKHGFWHIPEIMLSTGMAIIGIGLATIGCYQYAKRDGDNKEFKQCIFIVRPGDPRECKIKNPVFTEFLC